MLTGAPDRAAAADPAAPARAQLISLIDNVAGARAAGYSTRDSTGRTVDTIKILPAGPPSTYLGVYHVRLPGTFEVRVATSVDLLHWRYAATLARESSQPAIASLPDGAFLVAYERQRAPRSTSYLEFRAYPDLNLLLHGIASSRFVAPNTQSSFREGTPSIGDVTVKAIPGTLGPFGPDLTHSTIQIGFHYFDRSLRTDRNAAGVLADFSRWSTRPADHLNGAFPPSVAGNIGARDTITFGGYPFTVIEAQGRRGDFATLRIYLRDETTGSLTPLSPRTPGGSLAFGNPKATVVTDPAGRRALATSLYVFSEAAGPGEAGPLVYYSEF